MSCIQKRIEPFSNSIKGVFFLLIGTIIFYLLCGVFVPKRFPYVSNVGKWRYFYSEDADSIDVLISGTSHSGNGILPMELYEKYGIKSYNLSTSVQPIEATYYTLKEALKTQKPRVFCYDVSNLYIQSCPSSMWKFVLDEMRVGRNKVLLAKEYHKHFEDSTESMSDLLFSVLGYHTRWKELSKQDLTWFTKSKHYYGKGGCAFSGLKKGISVNDMNSASKKLTQNKEKKEYLNIDGKIEIRCEEDIIWDANIPDKNLVWLLKIKDLCDVNNIEFLAIKVPTVQYPQIYDSAWTLEKYKELDELCDKYEIEYYDLLYDTDIDLDWSSESQDGGYHLNLIGAQKVSAEIGNYISKQYGLKDERNEQWDSDLYSYRKLRKVILLELEQDFNTYIKMLDRNFKDKMIFIAASDEMSSGLNDKDIESLRKLGLKMNYSDAMHNSYVVVIDNGEIQYEVLSNRKLKYEGICTKSNKKYEIYSSGWWTNSGASIRLDENEIAVNSRGLNIVVYDDERGLILDSVCFDTWSKNHSSIRNQNMVGKFKEEYEQYIMEVEDRYEN